MLQRLLIEKIENRILVGIVMFLATMVLIGWIAINEPGRMQAFESQFLARSIERGGELFASNCTRCHGPDGHGLTGVAPGLNNPALFGHDFLLDINDEVERLTVIQQELTTLPAERDAQATSSDRREAIESRLAEIAAEFGENPTDAVAARLAELETQRVQRSTQLQGAIDKGYNPENFSRIQYLGWGGTLEAFLQTTLISGRPTSESYWPNPMVAWSRRAGGPLRDDQIQDLVNYILNWERQWTVEDLLAVNQFAIRPGTGAGTAQIENPIGTDVAAILMQLETVVGDPNNGQTIYNGALGCMGCHSNAAVAPLTEETWAAVQGERLQDPLLAAYTPEQYLVESIVNPGAYTVPGYVQAMPQNFGERLDIQMMADILAYLESYDQ